MSKTKELVNNTVIITVGKVATQLIAFFLIPIYTRFLDPLDYGFIDLVITYVSLCMPVVSLQIESALFRYLIDIRGSKEEQEQTVTNAVLVLFWSGIVSIAIILAITLFVDLPYPAIIAAMVLSSLFSGAFLQLSRGMGRNKVFAVSSLIISLSTTLISVLLICVFRTGAVGIMVATAVANALGAVFIIFKLKITGLFKISRRNLSHAKNMLLYSAPLVPNSIAWWVLNASDRTIISVFIGNAANGVYAIASRFSIITSSMTNIFNLSWTESASRYINDTERDAVFIKVLNSSIKIFGCYVALAIAGVSVVFHWLVNDQAYKDAYNYVPILMVASFFGFLISFFSGIYTAKKMSKQVMYTSMETAVINIIVNLALVKFIGVYASALSTAVAYAAMSFIHYTDIKRKDYAALDLDKKSLLATAFLVGCASALYYINIFWVSVISAFFVFVVAVYINKEHLKLLKRFKSGVR